VCTPAYDDHTTRAIAILGEVDECLLTEPARGFTRPEAFLGSGIGREIAGFSGRIMLESRTSLESHACANDASAP
jgi:hypothetical protein